MRGFALQRVRSTVLPWKSGLTIGISVALIIEEKNSTVWRVVMYKPVKQYKRWQVGVGTVLFLALMGLAGTSDMSSNQVILDEKVNVRDQIKVAVDTDANMWTAYYVARSREGK
jgi:hypothetical protein